MLRLIDFLLVGSRFALTVSRLASRCFAAPERALVLGGLMALVVSSGCDIPERVSLVPPSDTYRSPDNASQAADGTEGEKVASEDAKQEKREFRGDFEAWDAYFVGEKHVGYSHISVQANKELAREPVEKQRVELSIEDCLLIPRGPKSAFVQRHSHRSSETINGQMTYYKSSLSVGPIITTCEGTVDDTGLAVVKTRGIATTTQRLPWNDEHRGLLAAEESIRRSPLQIGEKRMFQTISPIQPLVTTVRLHCVAKAPVPMIDGQQRELLEIDVETDLGEDRKSYYVIWAEPNGAIRRAFYPSSNLVAYRTDKAVATKDIQTQEVAISVASTLINSKLDRSDEAKRVGFKLVQSSSSLAADQSIVRPQPTQFVRKLNETSLLVLVSTLGEGPKNGFAQGSFPVTDADRKPNAIVDSGETMVRRIAQAAGGAGKLGDRELSIELAQSANRLTQLNPTSDTFQRASEVARNAQGDSTAYAVLLAALLRAKGVASRVAFGLRYQESPSPRMVYHAWTLAHVDGIWLPLDATTGGIAAADRLTVSTSSLSDSDIGAAMKPVLDFLGTYEIDIVASATRY